MSASDDDVTLPGIQVRVLTEVVIVVDIRRSVPGRARALLPRVQ